MSSRPVRAVDLFCGGGGLSTALAEACEELNREVELIAVNHWGKAIETHKQNHPWATHLNAKIEELHPPDVIEPGTVNILIAAPECTHFSNARGGKPVKEQQRASPMHVLDWVGKLQPETILLENVPEFKSWGPVVDGKPTRDGTKFNAWKSQLEADRYSVRHTTLNAADYGDATSRRRFFVMARRDYRPEFPDPTHSKNGAAPGTAEWRRAVEIIDWADTGESIWTRSRPLSNNTMQRIAEGIRQYCEDWLTPYANVVAQLMPEDVKAMQEDTVAVGEIRQATETRDEPFLVESPAFRLEYGAESSTAIVMSQQSNPGETDTRQTQPSPVTAGPMHKLHTDPFVPTQNELQSESSKEYSVTEVTAEHRDESSVWPYLVPYKSERKGQRPRTHDIESPYPTVTATGSDPYLARPFLVEYYGNSDVASVDDPLPTVTTKDRHALCIPDLYPWGIDLRYRMLQPRELAAAQGFPPTYEFAGNKTETTKQIGNAVPVNLGKHLVKHLLLPTEQPTVSQYETPEPVVDSGEADD